MQEEIKINEVLRANIPRYANSSKVARENVLKAFEIRDFCAGVTLFSEGEPNVHAYFIMSGEVRLLKRS